jgi:hypothetical protein
LSASIEAGVSYTLFKTIDNFAKSFITIAAILRGGRYRFATAPKQNVYPPVTLPNRVRRILAP